MDPALSPVAGSRRALIVHPFRMRQWRTTLIWFIATAVVSYPLAYVVLLFSYHASGFSFSRAVAAIPQREFSSNGPAPQTWPLLLAAAILPLEAGVLPPRRLRVGILVFVLTGLVAMVLSVYFEWRL